MVELIKTWLKPRLKLVYSYTKILVVNPPVNNIEALEAF